MDLNRLDTHNVPPRAAADQLILTTNRFCDKIIHCVQCTLYSVEKIHAKVGRWKMHLLVMVMDMDTNICISKY